ncbi:MAG: methyl-accepting chemotaxis protein [Sulfurisoma sp.]|nr:methyl-accepting chemotaxis protein [Sulfurisoma sp.]
MNLRLRTKLLLMVAVPLLGMLWVSAWNTIEKALLARDMGRLQGLVAVATRVGALTHELQKERGMSAGFLGSKGANFAAELPAQREATEQRRKDLAAAVAGFDSSRFGAQLGDLIASGGKALGGLAEKRQAVSSQSITAPNAGAYYTEVIGVLLAVPGQLPALSPDKDIARLASAYGALLQAKERAGIERATLTNSLSADRFAPELFVKFVRNAAEQDTWFGIFNQYASAEHGQFASDKIRGAAVDAVAATKKAAVARMSEASLGMDAKTWFAAATARIDLMKEVEERIATDMTAAMRDLESTSTTIAWFYGIATILSAILVMGIGHRVVRRILAQIGGEPEAAVAVAHAVADGKLDNTIDLSPGDSGSLLASMKRMQDQLLERITTERRAAAENLRIKIALDNVSTGVMIADAERVIIYANASVRRILKAAEADIRKQLPGFDAGKLVGASIDGFHKNPAHQAKLLATFGSTYTANIEIGGRHLVVAANPVIDDKGERLGAVAEWSDRTTEVRVEQEVETLVQAALAGDFERRLALEGKAGFVKQLSAGLNQLTEVTLRGLSDVAEVLKAVAQGDLTKKVDADYQGLFGQLKDDVNTTVERLREVVGRIKDASEAINVAAREIAAGNQDLSSRTEEQASSLEETAASMEELNATVKQNAENAKQANELAKNSNAVAVKGGEMVKRIVGTMSAIQDSSKKIADIVGVIDSIAFQTNILALNAAVEAARAGEQGRGFAVVATEVRSLAQRSATAAKEIKVLIAESVDRVDSGAKLVAEAGDTMDDVVTSFNLVANLVTEIAGASREQSTGIEQVTQAVGQMDEVTQQNAALVEQAAAAAESLEEQASSLVQAVGMFKLAEGARLLAPALRDATPRQLGRAAPARPAAKAAPPSAATRKIAPPHLDDSADEWAEF